jgi:hypothetical protein
MVDFRYSETSSCIGSAPAKPCDYGCFFVWPYEGNSNEELYEAIERVMVTVVNQVGGVSYSCNGVLFWW